MLSDRTKIFKNPFILQNQYRLDRFNRTGSFASSQELVVLQLKLCTSDGQTKIYGND